MPAVFITNDMLGRWADEGKVRLDDTTLTLLNENRTVKLTPAVRFTKLIDGTDDPNKLIGKVKTKEQLVELGAEHYLDSVIFGDVGYTVVEGFLGDLSPPPATKKPALQRTQDKSAVAAPTSSPPVEPPPSTLAADTVPSQPTLSEAEALSQLFLSTVRER